MVNGAYIILIFASITLSNLNRVVAAILRKLRDYFTRLCKLSWCVPLLSKNKREKLKSITFLDHYRTIKQFRWFSKPLSAHSDVVIHWIWIKNLLLICVNRKKFNNFVFFKQRNVEIHGNLFSDIMSHTSMKLYCSLKEEKANKQFNF